LSTTIKVSEVNKDNQFGGRNIHVSLGHTSFRTPSRTAIHKEYDANGRLPHQAKITNPISEYIIEFNNSNIDDFLKGNGSFNKRSSALTSSTQIMREYTVLSTVKTPTNMRISRKGLKLFLELQNISDVSIISLPPFEYNGWDDFRNVVIDYSEIARKRGQEVMPILHIDDESKRFIDEFAEFRKLHENGLCNIIGFKYSSIDAHIQQFNEIHFHKDEEIWYHCFDVPRKPRKRDDNSAHLHVLQNWAIDTVSPYTKLMTQNQVARWIMENANLKPEDIKCDNRFDDIALGIFKEKNWKERYNEDLHCNCSICKDKNLDEFKEKYTYELNGSFNPSVLQGALKIHELFSGNNEFDISQDAVKSDDLKSYFKSKELTKDKIEPP